MSKVIKTSAKKKKKAKVDENKRVPCPFCKELILTGAKKCRFCKENLIEEEKETVGKSNFINKNITPPGPYKIWVLSMVVFLVSLFQTGINDSPYWFIVIIVSVIVGFIAFLALLASTPNSKGKYGIISLLTFIIFFGLLFNYEAIAKTFGLKPQFENKIVPSSNSVNITISPSPTSIPLPSKKPNNTNFIKEDQIDCIGPDGKQFKTTMEECKNLNEKWGKPVDYILDCNIHPDCGGGVVRMSKSQCESPCSGLSNSNSNSVPQNTSSGSQLNFYCYNNTYDYSYYTSSGEQCNLDNAESACRGVYKSIYDSCMTDCTSAASNRGHDCIYNYSEPETTTCLDESNTQHQQCMDSCDNTYQADVVSCY